MPPVTISSSTDSEADVKIALGNPLRIDAKSGAEAPAKEETTAADDDSSKTPAVESAPAEGEGKAPEPLASDKPKKSNLDKRFAKMTKEKNEAARRAEYWEGEAKRIQSATQPPKDPKAPAEKDPNVEPSQDDFTHHTDYIKAWTKWSTGQAMQEASKKNRETEVQNQAQNAVKEYQTKAQEFAKSKADYNDRLDKAEAVAKAAPAVFDRMLRGGPELTYALTEDIDFWQELNSLPADEQLERIGEVKARLRGAAPKAGKEADKKVVEEKPQPKPVSPVGSKVTVIKDPEKMSMREYDANRRQGWAPTS